MKTRPFTHWRRKVGALAILSGAILAGAFVTANADAPKFGEIGPGKLTIDTRIRYEYIDGKGGADDVNGLGERTRLGYSISNEEGVAALVEIEDVRFADSKDRPGLDVPTTELNQAWISAGGAKLGRQVYTLDDHRFIGHVGWRQNIQSFDALTGALALDGQSKLNLAYLHSVRRINATSQDLEGILLNASRSFSDELQLTAFGYFLDFDRPVLASSDTIGLRATGSLKGDAGNYSYSLSYAQQGDNSGSGRDFDLDYLAGELNASASGITLGAGFEILEGDGISGFTTPLATVHKFNGFADQFAGTSLGLAGGLSQGLVDYYAKLGFKIPEANIPVTLFYHHFETDSVDDFLGDEIDAVATYKLNDYATFITKYALYRADSDGPENVAYGGRDKTVFTLEVNLNF